jgi:hypothetical protein
VSSSDDEQYDPFEHESSDDSEDDDLSDYEEIDESEVLDIITDQERHEIAEDLLREIIRLGRDYRLQ